MQNNLVTCPGSQFGEDSVLRNILGVIPIGTYVEVGLYHPVECSNTWQFYLAGWRGLLIEPIADHWERILRERPRDQLWRSAAGNFCGTALMNIHGQRSSFRHQFDKTDEVRTIQVDPLEAILHHFPNIRDTCRLCSIDVEGWEKEVLEGIDWVTFHPEAFVIEYASWPEHGSRDVSKEWIHLLIEQGYKEAWRGEINAVFTAVTE